MSLIPMPPEAPFPLFGTVVPFEPLRTRRDPWHPPLFAIRASADRLARMAEGGPIDGPEHRWAAPPVVQDPIPHESTLHGA